MWRNVLAQALYQLCLLGYLLAFGATEFAVPEPESAAGRRKHFTLIFNAFVFCQIFNEFNARSIGDDANVLRGLATNPIFQGVIVFTVLAQVRARPRRLPLPPLSPSFGDWS